MNILYVLRQRFRALVLVFVAIAAIYIGYAALHSREYTAYAQVSDYNSRANGNTAQLDINSAYLAPLRSSDLIQKVAAGLSDEDRRNLTAPFGSLLHWGPGPGVVQVLLGGREFSAAQGMVDVGFQHPNPAVAASIANAMANEFVRESNAGKTDRMNQSLADLMATEKAQQAKLDTLHTKMAEMAKQYGEVNLDPSVAPVLRSSEEELKKEVQQDKNALDTLTMHRQQLKDQTAAKKPLINIDFIRTQSSIAQLYSTALSLSNHLEQLQAEGFQAEAPAMTDAKDMLDVAMKELNSAVQAAADQVELDWQAANKKYQQNSAALQDLQNKDQELASARTVYQGLVNDSKTANDMLSKTEVTLSDAQTKFNLTDPNYAVLASAEAPAHADPLPWARLAMMGAGLGAGGAVLLLFGFVIFRPPPKQEREEYERRRRRHRHFHSSHHRSSSRSKSSSESSSSSRHRH